MQDEREEDTQSSVGEDAKQLCLTCLFPNNTSDHFCGRCGAPLSSYAATAPFERIFAEGHAYRQASENPRSFIVVLGIWLLFGTFALAGVTFLGAGSGLGFPFPLVFGFLWLVLSGAMIWKTTRNYFAKRTLREPREA